MLALRHGTASVDYDLMTFHHNLYDLTAAISELGCSHFHTQYDDDTSSAHWSDTVLAFEYDVDAHVRVPWSAVVAAYDENHTQLALPRSIVHETHFLLTYCHDDLCCNVLLALTTIVAYAFHHLEGSFVTFGLW